MYILIINRCSWLELKYEDAKFYRPKKWHFTGASLWSPVVPGTKCDVTAEGRARGAGRAGTPHRSAVSIRRTAATYTRVHDARAVKTHSLCCSRALMQNCSRPSISRRPSGSGEHRDASNSTTLAKPTRPHLRRPDRIPYPFMFYSFPTRNLYWDVQNWSVNALFEKCMCVQSVYTS